jgi:hypothetical protein
MRPHSVVITFIGLAVACRGTPPERAVRQYAEAVKRGDCRTAWSLLSSETRRAYEYAVQHPSYLTPKSPQEASCNAGRIEDWYLRLMHTSGEANRVTVLVKRSVPAGPALPGWSPIFRKYVDDPIDVVFEEGVWRVEDRQIIDLVTAKRGALERAMRESEKARQREPPSP